MLLLLLLNLKRLFDSDKFYTQIKPIFLDHIKLHERLVGNVDVYNTTNLNIDLGNL